MSDPDGTADKPAAKSPVPQIPGELGDYTVGYGKPPVEKRFPKGRSGNPKGRPRRPRGPVDILNDPVKVNRDGRIKHMQPFDIAVRRAVERAVKEGSSKDAEDVLGMFVDYGVLVPPAVPLGGGVRRIPWRWRHHQEDWLRKWDENGQPPWHDEDDDGLTVHDRQRLLLEQAALELENSKALGELRKRLRADPADRTALLAVIAREMHRVGRNGRKVLLTTQDILLRVIKDGAIKGGRQDLKRYQKVVGLLAPQATNDGAGYLTVGEPPSTPEEIEEYSLELDEQQRDRRGGSRQVLRSDQLGLFGDPSKSGREGQRR